MIMPDFTVEEIQQILLVGERFLINDGTHPDDLKAALMQRLRDRQPALAGKIEQLGKSQMTHLCQTILAQRRIHA